MTPQSASAPSQAADQPATPRVWLVLGDKGGDNAQVEALAKALPWPCERRRLEMREPYVLGKPRVAASLYHIDEARSDPLEPPWPDLIITIGRRPSMAALWVREQSHRQTKVVLLGKPSGMLDEFDLVVAGGEAQLPPLPNVFPISLPLMRVDEAAVDDAVAAWRPRLGNLPRPLIGILVGGPTGPFVFDASVTRRLIQLASDTRSLGGTPYLTTSRRTPAPVVEALAAELPSGAVLFRWSPEAKDNPYRALLGIADGLIVTGDSISMMVEVVRLGKPLAILDLPTGALGAIDQLRRAAARLLFSPAARPGAGALRKGIAILLYRTGIISYTRDFRAFHRMLFDRGLAVPAGQPFVTGGTQPPDDVSAVAARIEALLGHH